MDVAEANTVQDSIFLFKDVNESRMHFYLLIN